MELGGQEFRHVWLVDFEFHQPPGERPSPLCVVAHDAATGRQISLWQEDLVRLGGPPYSVDGDCLFVAYYASAEIGCHLALGWSLPHNTLDLFAEFRCLTNGLKLPAGNNLIGALIYLGLDPQSAQEKEVMRDLAKRGGPYASDEREALLAYCASDVRSLGHLLRRMSPHLDIPRALLRGRYMAAAARMESCGVPIDVDALDTLKGCWPDIQRRLISHVDSRYGVYEGRTFKADRFAEYLRRSGIPWPRLPSGKLDLKDETFREMSRAYPDLVPLQQLRQTISALRSLQLTVGHDGRNRTILSAYRSKTGRNQPSAAKFIFGPAVWLRGLIRPPENMALAYIDWAQQEFGIAASLSQDQAMMDAYNSGDPYLTFAVQGGQAPPEATRKTHADIRERFKTCALGVQYGMMAGSLAMRIQRSPAHAEELLRLHRQVYPTYWRWSQAAVDYAMLYGRIFTAFGWELQVRGDVNVRSVANFPIQANGAEMLRIACILATERGIRICAPVHDAILIEAPAAEIQEHVAVASDAMTEASRIVLDGFELRSDVKTVIHPDRYMDGRGQGMWDAVWETVDQLRRQQMTSRACRPVQQYLPHPSTPIQSHL